LKINLPGNSFFNELVTFKKLILPTAIDLKLRPWSSKMHVMRNTYRKIRTAILFIGSLPLIISMHGSDPYEEMGKEILEYVNADRKSNGLKPLELNSFESSVAQEHSKNMASGKTPFGHKGMEARIKKINKEMGPISNAGENVAVGQMNASEVVKGWLNSPGHKRNIEGDFTLTGIGYAKDNKGEIYFTEIFTK
jgi:uncharacterized protein YkwD